MIVDVDGSGVGGAAGKTGFWLFSAAALRRSSCSRRCGFLIVEMSKPIAKRSTVSKNKMNTMDWQTLPAHVREILEKYRIISEQERKGGKSKGWTTAHLRTSRDSEGRILGEGYMVNLDVIEKLIEADTSPDGEWLDWMLFQCGGGQEGQRRSTQSFEQTMDRFIDERVRGYRDTSGKYHPPVSKAEAEEKWNAARGMFRDVLMCGDQDTVERLHVFGFHRNWPGPNNWYAHACDSVSEFLSLAPKTKEMNAFMLKNGAQAKVIKMKATAYSDFASLDNAIKRVKRFYASKAAREDIRLEKIYEDDFLEITCPLTYAAAVKYGWDGWNFASVETFETQLEGDGNNFQDYWRNMTGKDGNVIVYIQFHVPVPSWVSFVKGKFERYTMQNLALLLDKKQLKMPAAQFYGVPTLDEESRQKYTLSQFRELIEMEPSRVFKPESEEYPVVTGPSIYETQAEADEIVRHLGLGLRALQKWAETFDPKTIVSDYMPAS